MAASDRTRELAKEWLAKLNPQAKDCFEYDCDGVQAEILVALLDAFERETRLDEAKWWNDFVIHMHPVLESQAEPCVLCNRITALAAQPTPEVKK